jgi:hypothetical protein
VVANYDVYVLYGSEWRVALPALPKRCRSAPPVCKKLSHLGSMFTYKVEMKALQ